MSIRAALDRSVHSRYPYASLALAYGVGRIVGLPALRAILRSPLLQSTVFAGRARHLQRASQLGGLPIDLARARSRLLLRSAGARWRLLDLSRRQFDISNSWLTIRGLEHFDTALRRGPVVLISSHFGVARVAPVLLATLGYDILSLEANSTWYSGIDGSIASRIKVEVLVEGGAFPARSALAAQRRLRAGGVVHLAADGNTGRAHAVLPFCGSNREVRSTFAGMAVDTGAVVIPVFAPVDEEGRVPVEFLAPLDPGPPLAPRADRVNSLVRQYFSELERRWQTDPGNVPRLTLLDHLNSLARTGGGTREN